MSNGAWKKKALWQRALKSLSGLGTERQISVAIAALLGGDQVTPDCHPLAFHCFEVCMIIGGSGCARMS
jgi:hypothetical protein